MTEDRSEDGKIQPPRKHRLADVGRASAKGGLGMIPVVGSPLAEAAGMLLPDPTAQDRERWEGDVTEGVNDLHGRVQDIDQRTGRKTVSLEGGAALAAKYMVESCPDGLAQKWVAVEDIQEAHPDVSRDEILDGLGDLESYGLINTISFVGAPDRYKMTQYGYEVLDGPVMGWNTTQDARQIAALVVQGNREGVRVEELDTALAWPRRRFNPALRMVVDFVDRGRVSQSIQPDYVTRWFSPNNAERAELRRFAAGG